MYRFAGVLLIVAAAVLFGRPQASYTNFEVSHVHPLALTPSRGKLLAVNTPDALLEVFTVEPDGSLNHVDSIPVGLEPVSVTPRSDGEAWVVNHLSDSISIVDLAAGVAIQTLAVGDEPTDVVFAQGKAFVAVSQEDVVKVYSASSPGAPITTIPIFSREVRALATDGSSVFAVPLKSGNRTTAISASIILANNGGHNQTRLNGLGLNGTECVGSPPAYPGLPPGVVRNPALQDPPYQDPNTPGVPPVSLIVQWDGSKWADEDGQDWTHCLPFRLPDQDLFVIDATPATPILQSTVSGLGTSLFEVSVQPGPGGKIYVPHTDARNFVRFEHPLGVQGHVVDNRIAIVDPAAGFSVTQVDLNTHINRGSDPATNLSERLASLSQPGMMAWSDDGSTAYLTAIGSRKLFVVDGGCLAGNCVFGSDRSQPDALDVGEGPTGVAVDSTKNRAYVLNRFSSSIAVVSTDVLAKLDEIALHDPSPDEVKEGRRFLYDGILTSGHGDAACASCHLFGDMDGLAWDLGDPSGDLAPYGQPGDNVRFILNDPSPEDPSQPQECPAATCAAHLGFDPQKGPMTTQTFRRMLEPLHWRGDRPTMLNFNKAFVGLMGTADLGPVNGEPAGLSDADMRRFRDFAMQIEFPPNPYRNTDDTLPDQTLVIPGLPFAGNPESGRSLFMNLPVDSGRPCVLCHTLPFGTAGGKAGGLPLPPDPPGPSTDRAALLNGTAELSFHSDLKVPHLRNMYEKFGPVFGVHPGTTPDRRTGFGFIHDGSIPDMGTFLSSSVFTMTVQQARDLAAFTYFFPTGVKPAVGKHFTLPAAGAPGDPAGESLLALLVNGPPLGPNAGIKLGDPADPDHHCELVATTFVAGERRAYRLDGGVWLPDRIAEAPLTTTALRQAAQQPVTFLCGTPGSGPRLGGDRDQDGRLDLDDCDAADPGALQLPGVIDGLAVDTGTSTRVHWNGQELQAGSATVYDLVGLLASEVRSAGLGTASCLSPGLADPEYFDPRTDPPPGDVHLYIPRARNGCGDSGYGTGRAPLDAIACM